MNHFKLLIEDATGTLGEVALAMGSNTIGRASSSRVLVDTELTSRKHAKLVVTPQTVEVFDLDSHNGLFVNGEKVRQALLKPGDALYLGGQKLSLAVDDAATAEIDPESQLVWARSQQQVQDQVAELEMSGTDASLIAEDPRLRNLALLHRMTERYAQAKSSAEFQHEVMVLVRDLCKASTVVLVLGETENDLKATAVLREGVAPSEDQTPLSWPLVKRVFSQGKALYSRDQAASQDWGTDVWDPKQEGAVLCVPVQKGQRTQGSIFVTRPFAEFGFLDQEVESVIAIAQILATRLEIGADAEPTTSPIGDLEAQFRRFHPGRQSERILRVIQGGPFAEENTESEKGAVLYLHLAGVGSLLEKGEKAQTLQALETFFWVAQDLVAGAGGYLENVLGTGLAMAFPGAIDERAVAALNVAVGTINQALPPALAGQLTVHAGLACGNFTSGVIGHEKPIYTLYGHSLTMATRVAEIAQAGQIVCTRDVREALTLNKAVQVVDLGPHALRGLSRPVELFLADIPGARGHEEGLS